MMTKCVLAALMALGVGGAMAQAPAGAPAGATGICKDGTYSMAASKSGACGGHKGVQTWYAATPAKTTAKTATMPAPTPVAASATSTVPAPKPVATVPAKPATAVVPAKPAPPVPAAVAAPASPAAATAKANAKAGPAATAAAKTQAAGGGPGLVWVNTESNVYHCNGDTFYGKTKVGAYMSEADAKAKGAHGDHGKTCAGK